MNESERKVTVLATLRGLTDEERLAARQHAQESAIAREGRAPRWADYAGRQVGDYPAWVTRLVAALLLVVLAAAGNVSVFRVFTAGRDAFLESLPGETGQAAIVGGAAFLLAEFTVIVSVLARRILFAGRRGNIMFVPAALGMAMALVGNAVIARPSGAWGILETFVPPVAVLFMSLIGEQLALDRIKDHHADKVAYETAKADWERRTSDPENLPGFRGCFANALKDGVRAANSSGQGMKARIAFMNGMTPQDWWWVVEREHRAENWYEALLSATPANPTPPPSQVTPEPTAADGRDLSPQLPHRPLLPTPANTSDRPTG